MAAKNKAFMLRERDEEAALRWPWVTRVEVVGDVPPSDGVSLDVIDWTAYPLENGPRELTPEEFEGLARGLLG